MQIGDPKKTAILAVVAVAALGFCFKQLFGGGGEPKPVRQAGGNAEASNGQAPASGKLAMLQLDPLRGDAFSHPRLAPKTAGNANSTSGAQTNPATGGAPHPDTGAGQPQGTQLPGPFANGGSIDMTPDPRWPIPLSPIEAGQKPDPGSVKVEKVVTHVTLKAIFKVNQRLAYISIDGQEARGFRSGDPIKDDIQVVFVNDDSVIVKSGTKTVTLKVGQQGDL